LQLVGWVANQTGPVMPCYEENLEALQQRLPAPLLGEVPMLSPFDAEKAATFLSSGVLWGR